MQYVVDLSRSAVFLGFGRPEVSRATEMAVTGLALPLLLYMWMPTYRKFCTEADSDDLRPLARKKE